MFVTCYMMTRTPSPDNKQNSCECSEPRAITDSFSPRPPPLHVSSLTGLALGELKCTQLLPCARVSPHVLQSHVFDCFYQPVLLCLESSDLNWIWNVFCPSATTCNYRQAAGWERAHSGGVERWEWSLLLSVLFDQIRLTYSKSPCGTLLGQCFCSACSTFNLNYWGGRTND